MNVHHKRALMLLGVTAALDIVLGIAYGHAMRIGEFHGIYCATGMADTEGCDVVPVGIAAYWLAFGMQLTMIPLFGSVLAFFTTGLTADHIDMRHDELKERL